MCQPRREASTTHIKPAPGPEPRRQEAATVASRALSGRLQNDERVRSDFPDCPELPTLLAYTPKSLLAHEWALCRQEAVAAVCATDLGRGGGGLQWLSRLCLFLALDPDWDHEPKPDLKVLTSRCAIAQSDTQLSERRLSLSGLEQARGLYRGTQGRHGEAAPAVARQEGGR